MRIESLAFCIAAVPAVVLAAVLAPPPGLAQEATRPTAAQVEHGRTLFLADGCAACHGTVGQGSRVTGPRLAPTTMPLQPFLHILRHPANNMPPYVAEVLSDADARDIHAYLESLPGPIEKVQDVPALNR
jgi:mono/diheme cytochrome c family protein